MAIVETLRLAPAPGRAPSKKNIIICSDGTGNTAIKGRGTNVFKLFEAVDSHGHRANPALTPQVTYYDDGVGTESFKYLRAFAGATGWGLSRNVKQLYLQLVRVYEPGDQIYLFGFSRGAFTVRTLAGLIATCGILDLHCGVFETDAALRRAVKRAYQEYRKKCRTKLAQWLNPKPDLGTPFCDRHRLRHPKFVPDGKVPIRFIGVWDTVDAVGLPLRIADLWNDFVWRFKFNDRKLSPLVEQACQALAIDDERAAFTPVLWDEREEKAHRIEQIWFAGCHSNVGGGYPRQGMSLVPLDWMMTRAEAAGVRFIDAEREYYRDHRNVDDKLYDPRAGLSVLYRWKPRNVHGLCEKNGVDIRMHASAFERVARGTEGYAPGNIPPEAHVVTTRTPSPVDVRGIERILAADGAMGSVLANIPRTMRMGRASYQIFLTTLVLVLGGLLRQAYWTGGASGVAHLATAGSSAIWALPGLLMKSPVLLAVLVVGLLIAWLLARATDARIDRACSEFWHERQSLLLKPLMLQTDAARDGQSLASASGSAPM